MLALRQTQRPRRRKVGTLLHNRHDGALTATLCPPDDEDSDATEDSEEAALPHKRSRRNVETASGIVGMIEGREAVATAAAASAGESLAKAVQVATPWPDYTYPARRQTR